MDKSLNDSPGLESKSSFESQERLVKWRHYHSLVVLPKLTNEKYERHEGRRSTHNVKNVMRSDKFGNTIIKRNKSHKISFVDQLDQSKKIAEVYSVESLKRFNSDQGNNKNCFECIII